MRLKFDYSKLLGRIKEKGFTQETFAEAIGIGISTLSLKLSNKAYFKQNEIDKACDVLGIDKAEIGAYFFAQKV